ncbi:unnamed protein product [Rotaria sordida]|uniref:Uncharacterized protein n=1 Tax=Rotaria sordida TaxID=392033 RepID=A0A814MEZ4_9BILA|nr:unnamed protein product [Rotaria sordida]CAF3642170.1 unnamed protein product [Rotaria sordida]
MQTYYYALWLLTLSVVLISSRFIYRPINNEQNEDIYDSSPSFLDYIYPPSSLAAYLNNLHALEMHDGKLNDDDGMLFERETKSIRKGDPREFMG